MLAKTPIMEYKEKEHSEEVPMKKTLFLKRLIFMLMGILMIGICVGCYRLSIFGVDAFTCMNLGVSGFLNFNFGTWQLFVNAVIIVFVFLYARNCIGLGTVVNMVCVGYLADFVCYLIYDVLHIEMTLPLRIIALILGTLLASFGVACYITAEMGIGPYDSVAILLEKWTKGKIPFRFARIATDITCIVIGVIFCLIAGNPLAEIIGLGTIINAFCNGPLIQWFKTHVVEPAFQR